MSARIELRTLKLSALIEGEGDVRGESALGRPTGPFALLGVVLALVEPSGLERSLAAAFANQNTRTGGRSCGLSADRPACSASPT